MSDPLYLDPGSMRHQVSIQSQSASPDPTTGAPTQAWQTVRTTWASISTVSSKELFLANQFADQASHLVSMRWTSVRLSAGMRVVFGSRVFTVQNVENVLERNIRLNLTCQEIDGASS